MCMNKIKVSLKIQTAILFYRFRSRSSSRKVTGGSHYFVISLNWVKTVCQIHLDWTYTMGAGRSTPRAIAVEEDEDTGVVQVEISSSRADFRTAYKSVTRLYRYGISLKKYDTWKFFYRCCTDTVSAHCSKICPWFRFWFASQAKQTKLDLL